MNTANIKVTAYRLNMRFPLGEEPVPIISEGLGGLIATRSEKNSDYGAYILNDESITSELSIPERL